MPGSPGPLAVGRFAHGRPSNPASRAHHAAASDLQAIPAGAGTKEAVALAGGTSCHTAAGIHPKTPSEGGRREALSQRVSSGVPLVPEQDRDLLRREITERVETLLSTTSS
jgi:hypothetical protein